MLIVTRMLRTRDAIRGLIIEFWGFESKLTLRYARVARKERNVRATEAGKRGLE